MFAPETSGLVTAKRPVTVTAAVPEPGRPLTMIIIAIVTRILRLVIIAGVSLLRRAPGQAGKSQYRDWPLSESEAQTASHGDWVVTSNTTEYRDRDGPGHGKPGLSTTRTCRLSVTVTADRSAVGGPFGRAARAW